MNNSEIKTMNYSMIKLQNIKNVENEILGYIRTFTDRQEDEIYNEKNYFGNFPQLIIMLCDHYGKNIVNIDNADELPSGYGRVARRFINRLPILYGRQKAFISKGIQKVSEETISNKNEIDTTNGINSTDYAIDTDGKKFGQLMRTKGENNSKNIYQNMDATFKYSVDLYLEKGINSFNDLFIFYHESERRG